MVLRLGLKPQEDEKTSVGRPKRRLHAAKAGGVCVFSLC
jgi:hypothetical protein